MLYFAYLFTGFVAILCLIVAYLVMEWAGQKWLGWK